MPPAGSSNGPPTWGCRRRRWRWPPPMTPTSLPSSKSSVLPATPPPRASGTTEPPSSVRRRPPIACTGSGPVSLEARGPPRGLWHPAAGFGLTRRFGELDGVWGRHRLAGAPADEGEELANHAAPEDQHRDNEDRSLDHQHPLAEPGQVVLHIDDDGGADGWTKDGAHAADQGHQHHLARHLPCHIGQRGQLEHHGLGGAGETGQRRRDHERDQLEAADGVAERNRPRLVLADGL